MAPTNRDDDPLADAPAELLVFLDQAASLQSETLGIAMLGRAACREYSRAVRGTALGEALGLVALEDANNSLPYCYVVRGPSAGRHPAFGAAGRSGGAPAGRTGAPGRPGRVRRRSRHGRGAAA